MFSRVSLIPKVQLFRMQEMVVIEYLMVPQVVDLDYQESDYLMDLENYLNYD